MLAQTPQFLRFTLDWRKCVEGIDAVARALPGVTQYYVGKIFYFADKEHFLDWGRPISGDRYVAMPHGPVPSNIYDYLKEDSGEPDEILDELTSRVSIATDGNKRRVYSRNRNDLNHLSGTDVEYLTNATLKYGHMSFGELKQLSHQESAYVEAEKQVGLNNEMNLLRWADDIIDGEHLVESILNCQTHLIKPSSKNGTF
jgi:uncharacterized phage-associated protein